MKTEFNIKLDLTKLVAIGGIFVSIIGGAFAFGVKIEYENCKLQVIKISLEYEKKISVIENETLTLNRQLTEANEDNIYLTNRFEACKSRTVFYENWLSEFVDLEAQK